MNTTSRRRFLEAGAASLLLGGCIGRGARTGQLEMVWGGHGLSPGRFHKPRAIAIDRQDRVYVVDMTGRIQVFTADGRLLRWWRTPKIRDGKPCGLGLDRDNRLLVADTHYFRVLMYSPDGQLLPERTIGGVQGHQPGQFEFVTDAVQDSRRNYYIAEYGQFDRIQKFSSDGQFLLQWGGHGEAPGQFIRPQGLEIDDQDRIWVADACNHRIQVFDATGSTARLVMRWGSEGHRPGQLRYPYGVALDGRGHVYVCEFGNHRVQKLTLDGQPLASWGTAGRLPGQLAQPWGLAINSRGKIFVVDTYNHRVQRFRL